MTRYPLRHLVAAVLMFAFASSAAIAADEDYERLAARVDRLAADPALGQRATLQLERARASLAEYKEAGRRNREKLIYVVERRIDTVQATAEADRLESRRDELLRENDRLQLTIARRDAAQARRELERQLLQAQIRAEESERLAREAEAARLEGEQAAQAAEAARAEAAQAKRMAAAQAKAAALAKKEAELEAAISGKAPAKPAAAKPKPAAKSPAKPKKAPAGSGK